MKSKIILFYCLFMLGIISILSAQPAKKPATNQKAQSEMDKAMAEAMKGMSLEEQAEMKKIMKDIMPAMTDKVNKTADYPDFASNKDLIPKKDVARIATISKKELTNADMSVYATNLYNKIMIKGDASEIALIKSVLPKAPKANDLSNASVLAMMQGHPQAAMALSMKAVQLDPANSILQNNMASLLTQYGFPEIAIPVLNKLYKQFPDNSTILNNLGQAWFGLGGLDSANIYIKRAIKANPFHPEAKVCAGLIEEMNGDPAKAEQNYIEAMENSPNPMIEKILLNKAGNKGLDKIDFEKLKRSIPIYEYFPVDWIKMPHLSDNVEGYENDMAIKNGYEFMFEKLKKWFEFSRREGVDNELNKLLDKEDEEAFIKEMTKASIMGVNKMSLTAFTIQKILHAFMAKWSLENTNELAAIHEKIEKKRNDLNKQGNNKDNCTDYDRRNNQLMIYANPMIRDFHKKRIETYRTFLNAMCTWVWYISGNPKNAAQVICYGLIETLIEMNEDAIKEQLVIEKCGVELNGNRSNKIKQPHLPNLCPTTILFPSGKEWLQLSTAAANFDLNSFGIKNSITRPVPNTSASNSSNRATISEPGLDHFIQTTIGSITVGMISRKDPTKDEFQKNTLKYIFAWDCEQFQSSNKKNNDEKSRKEWEEKRTEVERETRDKFKKALDKLEQFITNDKRFEKLKDIIKELRRDEPDLDFSFMSETIDAINKMMNSVVINDSFQDSVRDLDFFFGDDKYVEMSSVIKKIWEDAPYLDNSGKIKITEDLNKFVKNHILIAIEAKSLNSGVQPPGTFTPQKGLFQ